MELSPHGIQTQERECKTLKRVGLLLSGRTLASHIVGTRGHKAHLCLDHMVLVRISALSQLKCS